MSVTENVDPNKQQWLYALKAFDPIKGLPSTSVNKIKRNSQHLSWLRRTRNNYISPFTFIKRKNIETPNSQEDSKPCTSNNIKRRNCVNESESDIIGNSFYNESKVGLDTLPNRLCCISNSKTIANPLTKESSSTGTSKESGNIRCHEPGEKLDITFANKSMPIDSKIRKQLDPEDDLDLLIIAIKKDFRSNAIRKRLQPKKGGYLEKCRKAIDKSKSDIRFIDYEQRVGILNGCREILNEKIMSYGVCVAGVQTENGHYRYFLLDKSMQTRGNVLVAFADMLKYYIVNGKHMYIQPNKVVQI